MDTIIIVNAGFQPITCEDVSQNGLPIKSSTVLININEEKTLCEGNSGNKIKITIGVGEHTRWESGNQCWDELSKMYPQVFPPPVPMIGGGSIYSIKTGSFLWYL
jgi:hypothetical protein